jgi:hypothetical protein
MAPVVNVALGSPVRRQIVCPVLSHKPMNSERAITGSNRCVAASRCGVTAKVDCGSQASDSLL